MLSKKQLLERLMSTQTPITVNVTQAGNFSVVEGKSVNQIITAVGEDVFEIGYKASDGITYHSYHSIAHIWEFGSGLFG